MRRNTLVVLTTLTLALGLSACKVREQADRVTSGAQGPGSPATSGEHGADAFNRAPFMEEKEAAKKEHQTAGLMPEYTNGKADPTMEGSGNLAWQGSYERDRREKMQAQAQPSQTQIQPKPTTRQRPSAPAATAQP